MSCLVVVYYSFHKLGIPLDFSSKQDEWTFGRLEGDFTRPNAGKKQWIKGLLLTSHSAYVATSTKLDRAKIDEF